MSALLVELADVFARFPYAALRCTPTITTDEDGRLRLSVDVVPEDQPSPQDAFRVLSLFGELQYICDVAQMRALCAKYDIPSAQLEALLPKKED